MKKFLLSTLFLCSVVALSAQNVSLNEIYPNKGGNYTEYFELVNTSASITGEDLSHYTLVTYFSTATEKGFYVLNLPNYTLSSQDYFTGAPSDMFTYPGGTAVADYSWNDLSYLSTHGGSTTKYTLNSAGTGYTTSTGSYTDIFNESNGLIRNPNVGIYAVFLFYDGMLVDALLGSSNSNTLPAYITSLPALPSGAFNYSTTSVSFSTIASSGFIFENVAANIGLNGGFYRTSNGRNCGIWAKASAESEFTPNMSNGLGSNSLTINTNFSCGDATFTYDIVSGPNPAFPVTVSLYYDVNNNGVFDANDQLVGTHTEGNVNDPSYTFNIVPDVSILVVFEAQTGSSCSNQILLYTCSPAGPTPVTLLGFNVAQKPGYVALNWSTSMELDNRGFEIQRRTTRGFETVAFVSTNAPKGSSDNVTYYNFQDETVDISSGIVYYRLRQVDYNGKYAYSDIRSLRYNTKDVAITVYPNPAHGSTKLIVPSDAGSMDISLLSITGNVLSRTSNFTGTRLDFANLNPGVYMIRVMFKNSGEQVVQKLIVQ